MSTNRVSPQAGWKTAARLVDIQQNYGRDFIDALGKGGLSPAQAQQRAALYAGSTIEAFERGKGELLGVPDLPDYPTVGCEGVTNCRCFWDIHETTLSFECTWVAVGDSETCAWCAGNATQYAPFTVLK